MTAKDIKSMQLYPRAERILNDLSNLGYGSDDPVPVDVLNRFDQLHYHGTDALDAAIAACAIKAGDRVLEVGSGWGGCARYIAHASGAHVTAVELQDDYHHVGNGLTGRAGLSDHVTHINADFLTWPLPDQGFDHVVSWLALFHIPTRAQYLARIASILKPGGSFFAEDLYQIAAPSPEEATDFQNHLFPNSLVPLPEYRTTLEAAGLRVERLDDMTSDWIAFTQERLGAFRSNRPAYEAVHGADGYQVIETFYDKMAGYFARGLVGGLRVHAAR
ncbi:MAG: class I SAM-dependent methyltransferase [Pseudomonadota bacterium]